MIVSMLRVSLPAFLVLDIFAVLAGCSSDGAAEDAHALSGQIDAIDIVEPPPVRQKGVDALRALPLKTEKARAIRDTCVAGHEALLSAEEDSEKVRLVLAQKPEDELTLAEKKTLTATLDRSDEAIKKARTLLDECRNEASSFAVEHPLKRDPSSG